MKPAAPLIATSDLLPLTPNQSETYPGTIKTVRYRSVNTLTMLPIEGDPELRLAKCVLAIMVLGFAPCLSYRYADALSRPPRVAMLLRWNHSLIYSSPRCNQPDVQGTPSQSWPADA